TERNKGRYHYLRCTYSRGKCSTGYVRQEVVGRKVAEVLTFDADVLEFLATALRKDDFDEKKFHEESIARLEGEHAVLQKRLDAMYRDKLDGRITAAFFDRMAGEARHEQERIAEAITQHRQANRGQLDQGSPRFGQGGGI